MDDSRRFYEKPNFWPKFFGVLFAFVFVLTFWYEIKALFQFILFAIEYLQEPILATPPRGTPEAVIILAINAIIYGAVYFIILRWVALFVLPARNASDRKQVFARLFDYVLGLHGPAVFVKNGEMIARKAETEPEKGSKDWFASLALVDMTSAIAIESRDLPGLAKFLKKPPSPIESRAPLRALGPGIGFLGPGERILGCVDLRMQSRQMEGVRGFTSDGIELTTTVTATFTLGEEAEVMLVIDSKHTNPTEAHLGLQRVVIDPKTLRIKSIKDDINPDDKREIYDAIQSGRLTRTDSLAMLRKIKNKSPYSINQERVIRAVITRPRNSSDGKLEEWTDLPARVAASVLLDDLSKITYDELYSLDSPEQSCHLYDHFKPAFAQKIKDLGILSYQFIQRKDGNFPKTGDIFKRDEYIIWEVRTVEGGKPLRERGIKVIRADFSDFTPTDDMIPAQRFDNWRSKWQKRTEITNAEYDYEIMRKMNHARADAQREIVYNLSQIFKLPGYSQDAMALRIFQALESAASNPATNKLLPRDTLEMLKNFQHMFLPPVSEDRQDDIPFGPGDDYSSREG